MPAGDAPHTTDHGTAATSAPARRVGRSASYPPAQGLYDPAFEHDACGVAFVADTSGTRRGEVVQLALTALENMDHRGASGAEVASGDGAGILIQLPDAFLRAVAGVELPPAGSYAAGLVFLPTDAAGRADVVDGVQRLAAEEGLAVLGWRELPVDPDGAGLGPTARGVMPHLAQLFVAGLAGERDLDLERLAFCLRKRAEHDLDVYLPSLSSRTLVYKGMLTTVQVQRFFPDLSDPRLESSLALVHSRFSTNTFPSWPLAHPYRYIAHNGEINTVRGNRNWMRTREALLASDLIPGDLTRLFPVVTPGGSDSASFDEVLELLHLAGRSLPHAVLMMIPEAWENAADMVPARRAFYSYHAELMEPWDGPACVTFTDGTRIGAVLDRNGLRPARYWVTDDGLVVLASEVGVLELDQSRVVRKGRLKPGRMFLVDLAQGRVVEDDEIKDALAAEHPYADWLAAGMVPLAALPSAPPAQRDPARVLHDQQVFGYTEEELRLLLAPMARTGAEPVGSMGSDTPIAVLSRRPRLLFDYFTQLFAQVTNPPLDAIREELVTSLATTMGVEGNLLDPRPESCRHLTLPYPVIDNEDLARLLAGGDAGGHPEFAAVRIDGRYSVAGGGEALAAALDRVREQVSAAIRDGARIVVLSDRDATAELAPIPSLLLVGAVHHHLVRVKSRSQVGLVVEAGDAREVHHVALLVGYGAAAVNPDVALDTVAELAATGVVELGPAAAVAATVKAFSKGVLKVMSKMGISTVASYTGAQVFEALGLGPDVVEQCFTGTTSKLGGIGYDVLATEVAARHERAHAARAHLALPVGGEYQWRREGELHLFNPETVFRLQHATRTASYDIFRQYTAAVDAAGEQLMTLRGLFRFKEGVRPPVPLAEVEPASEIVKRFATGAMSYGSISAEAHETLAVAMNALGGKSNTGEGGEDPERLYDPQRRSAVKQVASGRFGVTSEYLVNADDLQIKMAQGAKPGEGGQLPGHKVYPWIARTRHSTAGVGLISPPPHHDIYSIEDLAQLIHDLKNANDRARVHVKLVAEVGVGTVATGVSKAHADVVLVSGHDGGTGAAPLTSLKHAGAPWELGLAETQQTLLMNNLRDRITVQVDGQLKTGRDVVVAALLGAEEFGFATAPLVVSGCIMMRVCHLDTCPVGVATQNPELRRRFSGRPEFVETFFTFLAEEVRGYLAELGFRSIEEAVGRVESLDTARAQEHWKAAGLDLSPILHVPDTAGPRHRTRGQDHGLERALDRELIAARGAALVDGRAVQLAFGVRNVNRTVGTLLGAEVTRRYGGEGLPDGTIDITLTGSAGQSLGAFLPRGITLRLVGDANDYVGKGLSGGRIVLSPPPEAPFAAEEQMIAGNVLLYGATGGELFVRGLAGERFAVRNSGALAVVEGIGDHGCEYMTGGRVVVLGPVGRNLAAGMSGGIAYVLDLDPTRVNSEMVDLDRLDAGDVATVRYAIERHAAETGSAVARRLLADLGGALARISKVMPRDYKKALEQAAGAAAEGELVHG